MVASRPSSYHTEEAQLQEALAHASADAPPIRRFPMFSDSNVAPSVAHNMHVAFNVRRGSISLNAFVERLETLSHAAGFTNVLCNRLVPVPLGANGRADVSNVPMADDSYLVTEGAFKGWSLAYCKGVGAPDGTIEHGPRGARSGMRP